MITNEGAQTSTTKETIDYKTGNRTITKVFDRREWCVYIDIHFLDSSISDLMIFGKPFPYLSFVMKISATEDKIFGYTVCVQLKDNNSGCIYRENGNRYLTKKEMLDNFRLVINETIDMSKGQVYFEDAINKFSEMGFNLR
ncbi:MAG TPA: hypothetical protein OIL97_04480 [Oscillospiraceae bacterium]|nr:hypothetical protein [Oscillospiraceae bacterium]